MCYDLLRLSLCSTDLSLCDKSFFLKGFLVPFVFIVFLTFNQILSPTQIFFKKQHVFAIHRHSQSPVKHPKAFLGAIFEKVSILDVLQVSEYISANTLEFL